MDGSYNIGLTLVEKAGGRIINADTIIVIQTPAVLRVPNVFTPNDDGVNDLFKVFYNGDAVLDISIFTRTGTRVFNMKAPSISWDGRNSSGALVSPGTYYYVITSDNPGIKAQNGFFHVFYKEVK